MGKRPLYRKSIHRGCSAYRKFCENPIWPDECAPRSNTNEHTRKLSTEHRTNTAPNDTSTTDPCDPYDQRDHHRIGLTTLMRRVKPRSDIRGCTGQENFIVRSYPSVDHESTFNPSYQPNLLEEFYVPVVSHVQTRSRHLLPLVQFSLTEHNADEHPSVQHFRALPANRYSHPAAGGPHQRSKHHLLYGTGRQGGAARCNSAKNRCRARCHRRPLPRSFPGAHHRRARHRAGRCRLCAHRPHLPRRAHRRHVGGRQAASGDHQQGAPAPLQGHHGQGAADRGHRPEERTFV